jgi:hypothetical protein
MIPCQGKVARLIIVEIVEIRMRGSVLPWVGAGYAGPARDRTGPGIPGARRLAGHQGSAVGSISRSLHDGLR